MAAASSPGALSAAWESRPIRRPPREALSMLRSIFEVGMIKAAVSGPGIGVVPAPKALNFPGQRGIPRASRHDFVPVEIDLHCHRTRRWSFASSLFLARNVDRWSELNSQIASGSTILVVSSAEANVARSSPRSRSYRGEFSPCPAPFRRRQVGVCCARCRLYQKIQGRIDIPGGRSRRAMLLL